MNNLDEFKNKKVAILGLGIEGMVLADFLSGKVNKISFLDKLSATEIINNLNQQDGAKAKLLLEKNELISGENYLNDLSKFDIVFRSPGISFYNPKIQEALKNNVMISSQIKLFFDLCPCQIIGVTGTKGKGTTSSLIYEIMKKNLKFKISNLKSNPNDQMTNEQMNEKWEMRNEKLPQVYLAGNIGYPAITLIPELKSDDIVILELSSFQLMDLDKSPHIAVVTNLTVDHLDYHSDIKEYQNAKTSIVKFQTDSDFAVLNSNSTFDRNIIGGLNSQIKYFSNTEEKDAIIKDDKTILDPKNRSITICDLANTKLYGRHNLENIAAASLVADIMKIDPKIIQNVVAEFKGLPHRLEFVAEIDGVKYINDSFATNPEPTMAAIDSFAENKIIILGGSSKGADFSKLASKITKSKIKAVVLIGTEGKKIKDSLMAQKYGGKIVDGGNTMDQIIANAKSLAEPNDVIIFSPACASFDMFKNYKVRGEQFKTAVQNLNNEPN